MLIARSTGSHCDGQAPPRTKGRGFQLDSPSELTSGRSTRRASARWSRNGGGLGDGGGGLGDGGGGEGDGGGGEGDGGGGEGGGIVGGGGKGGGEETTHEPSFAVARLSKLLASGAMQPVIT